MNYDVPEPLRYKLQTYVERIKKIDPSTIQTMNWDLYWRHISSVETFIDLAISNQLRVCDDLLPEDEEGSGPTRYAAG